MIRIVLAAALLCALSAVPAGARTRVPSCVEAGTVMVPSCNGGDFLAGVKSIRVKMRREWRKRKIAGRFPETLSHVKLATGIIAPLAAKVAEIRADCGSRIVSALRHTFVAGTRRMSLHAFGKAVDMAGSPGCIYAHLAGWQGGYSTDYGRVRHVHLSYDPDGGREWGLRFVHGRHRYARRHHRHHRYAVR